MNPVFKILVRTLNKKLYKPRCAKGFRQHSFCISSIDPWNSLSQNVIDSSTVIEFNSALDKLLGQLGIYATWLSSIAYLQKQLRIFYIFTPRFWQ